MRFIELASPQAVAQDCLTLPWELRIRSRFAAQLDSGLECGVLLPRGSALSEGDKLRTETGFVAVVRAAPEELSVVEEADPLLLSRAAYHLGNRHVPLQIEVGRLRYQHDHVLDDMVRGLGLRVGFERGAFEPENGAYAGGSGHGHHHHGPGKREGQHHHSHEHGVHAHHHAHGHAGSHANVAPFVGRGLAPRRQP